MATRIQEKLFERYQYLSKKYANKIWSYEELAFEREDLVQEFNIKLIMAIRAYGRKWARYRRGEEPRPMRLKVYLETAIANKSRDFISAIAKESNKVRIDDIQFDFGVEDDYKVDYSQDQYVLNGIDLLDGLKGRERSTFVMHIKGYSGKRLTLVYGDTRKVNGKSCREFISSHIENLMAKYGSELLQAKTLYSSYSIGD